MDTPIYVSGYDEAGERVATALEQPERGWTFNEVDGPMLQELPNLQAVIDRMRSCGASILLACPYDDCQRFVSRVAQHLSRSAELN